MERDRDRSIESLLGDALKRHGASASADACLDAETAAAWADGALSEVERNRVEGHAASCARCQALVAALVRTSPPAAARSFWFRLPRVAWLAPLTAAAAALIVWAIVPPPAEKSAAPARATSASAPSAAAAVDRPLAEARPTVAPTPTAPQSAADKAVPQAKPREKAFADRRQDVDALAKKESAKVASPPSEPKRAGGRGGAAAAGAVVSAPAAAPADFAMRKSLAESNAQNAARSRLEAFQLATIVATPNSGNRWRIINDPQPRAVSVVEHSTDGGTTWITQQIGSPTRVVAGASPSPGVCWLVGPGGVVLQTTNATTWQRLAFPETIDLVAVRATDDRNATVTAADGRTFATADGGATWTPPRD